MKENMTAAFQIGQIAVGEFVDVFRKPSSIVKADESFTHLVVEIRSDDESDAVKNAARYLAEKCLERHVTKFGILTLPRGVESAATIDDPNKAVALRVVRAFDMAKGEMKLLLDVLVA